jgi:hypothetical protein
MTPALPDELQVFQPNAAVGATPIFFRDFLEGYQNFHILQLVIFYNESFEIVPNDTVVVRQHKLRQWLVDN